MTVKNLIQRVRDWQIKKLGGYTAKEYDTINRLPVREFTVDRRNVEHLTTRIQIRRNFLTHGIYPDSACIKHELTMNLLMLIEGHMKIMRLPDDHYTDVVVYEASIDIMRKD